MPDISKIVTPDGSEYNIKASTVNGHTVNSDVPSNAVFTDTNTWRNIKVNGTETLGNRTDTGSINFSAGSNVTLTPSSTGKTLTIAATDTTYESKSASSGSTAVSLCTRGEKYTWNNKQDAIAYSSASMPNNLHITGSFAKYGLLKILSITSVDYLSTGEYITLISSDTFPDGFAPEKSFAPYIDCRPYNHPEYVVRIRLTKTGGLSARLYAGSATIIQSGTMQIVGELIYF